MNFKYFKYLVIRNLLSRRRNVSVQLSLQTYWFLFATEVTLSKVQFYRVSRENTKVSFIVLT